MPIFNMGKAIKLTTLATLLALLTACAAGQKIDTAYQASTPTGANQANSAALQVTDNRPYVLDGDKDPAFIGKYRAAFGNPWDVKTEGEIPLADLLRQDIGSELNSRGFTLVNNADADRQLRISINDWNFDAYADGVFTYSLDVQVLSANAETLVTETFKGTKVVEGSIWTGPKAAFEREMPKLYAEIIQTILADDHKIMPVLTS